MNIEQALDQVERVASMRHTFSPDDLADAANRLRYAVCVYRTAISEDAGMVHDLAALDQLANGYFP